MKRVKTLVLQGMLICLLLAPAATTTQASISDGALPAMKSDAGLDLSGTYEKRGPFLPSSSVEPTTIALLGLGVVGLLWLGIKSKSE